MDHNCYRHPTVKAALDRAETLVAGWWDSEKSHLPAAVTPDAITALDVCLFGWWPMVVLRERIAFDVLDAQGFDIEALDMAVSEETNDSAIGDLLALDWSKAAVEARGFWDSL